MTENLLNLKAKVFDVQKLKLEGYSKEVESHEYEACRFRLNRKNIICRTAKITPKKTGQFVTFWKRVGSGTIAPFSVSDFFDYLMVMVVADNQYGIFLFPKVALIRMGIVSSKTKEGKRGFRIYSPWDEVQNKQAERAQKWQLQYFYAVRNFQDLERFKVDLQ